MNDYSKVFAEKLVSKAKKVYEDKELYDENKNGDGSLEIRVTDQDIKNILDRKRLKEGLKKNLVQDLESAKFKASECDTKTLCVTIPVEKIKKKTIKYSDIK